METLIRRKAESVPESEPVLDVVDVEEYGKRNERPPKARKYAFRIDKKRYEWPQAVITGLELLKLARKDPERSSVRQKLHGGQARTVEPGEAVDLSQPGTERFLTLCHDQTDG
jgi:hypothetical protein